MNESSNEPATPPVSPPPDSVEKTDIRTDAQRQKKQREARKGFFIHLIVYLLVIGGLAYLDYGHAAEGEDHWVQWPAMGWGIGIFFHGLGVFLNSRKK